MEGQLGANQMRNVVKGPPGTAQDRKEIVSQIAANIQGQTTLIQSLFLLLGMSYAGV